MKRFKNLEEYSSDELVIIAYGEPGDWQEEAVNYAKYLLEKRGIPEKEAIQIYKVLEYEGAQLWEKELEYRKNLGFTVEEIIAIAVKWPNAIFKDWYFAQNGYFKLRKQRLYALAGGFAFYFMVFFFIIVPLVNKEYDQKIAQQIKRMDSLDRVENVKKEYIDWSGHYQFNDTFQANRAIWDLRIEKTGTEHKGKLTIENQNRVTEINCIGLIKDNRIEFFPDTTYLVFDKTISYYDKMFAFIKKDGKLLTRWDRLQPPNAQRIIGTELFSIMPE